MEPRHPHGQVDPRGQRQTEGRLPQRSLSKPRIPVIPGWGTMAEPFIHRENVGFFSECSKARRFEKLNLGTIEASDDQMIIISGLPPE